MKKRYSELVKVATQSYEKVMPLVKYLEREALNARLVPAQRELRCISDDF